jgi:4-amino-4-deoxy-L-arabinose transferase-like glycosyltransferase
MWQPLGRINLADRATRIALLGALTLFTTLVYTWKLGHSPPHLNPDEVGNALNSYAISQTGRDEHGRFMPTFFIIHGHQDAQTPLETYLQAAFLMVLPLSSASLRLPNALVAVLSVLLMYWFTRTLFKREGVAFIAALCLATNPAMLLFSRFADGPPLLFPLMLASLSFLSRWFEAHQPRSAYLAGLFLGVAFYVDHSAKVTVPLFFLLVLVALLRAGEHRRLGAALASGGFICALVPFLLYFSSHPRMFAGITTKIRGNEGGQTIASGIASLLSAPKLQQTFATYLNYFNPVFMFGTGDASVTCSTGKAGVFLLPCLVLIPAGAYLLVRHLRASTPNPVAWVLLGMFVVAPLGGSIHGEQFRIARGMALLPLGSFFCAFCLERLALLRTPAARKVLLGAAALMALHWIFFVADYFTDFRRRSYWAFGFDTAAVFEPAVDTSAANRPVVAYLDQTVPFADFYWRFYAQKRGRPELMRRVQPFDPGKVDLGGLPSGAVMIWRASLAAKQRIESSGLALTKMATEPDGRVSFFLVRKM